MLINDKVDAVFIPDSPSRIKATDYNQIKNEIQECITEAGLTPTKDVIQLPQALRIMTAQSGAEEVAKIEAAGQTQLNAINTAGAQAVQDAQTAANTATTKATEAAGSATEAAESASTATTQAGNAADSAALAQKWATQTTAEVVSGQGYGAKYYAQQAAASATAADGSASTATTQATNASASASAAAQSAIDAANSAASIDTDNLAKTDLSNVSQLPQSRVDTIMPAHMDYVVDSYSDGEGNWYRVYKSGWIEQGGIMTFATTGTLVTFLKPFLNDVYSITTGAYANDIYTKSLNIYNKTAISFVGNATTDGGGTGQTPYSWYACGQGAE